MKPGPTRRDRGFTLIELGVVILIIGLLMSFLLAASWDGLRRAEERGTETLILKLHSAMADRVEALSQQRPPANSAHKYLSMTAVPGTPARFLISEERARLIAKIDYLRRELPDVFFVQGDDLYPLNFAGMGFYPQTASPVANSGPVGGFPAAYAPYVLPLGHGLVSPGQFDEDGIYTTPAGATILWGAGGNSSFASGEGIFGASYSVIGALTRQLGYPERGYNGADDNGNGLIDEFTAEEFGMDSGDFSDLGNLVNARLSAHRHITARSEMLYAILVGGAGPLGSVFNPDDFTAREVRDTDGDGLMEFVDAWGRPLQFYRWPVYFTTDFGSAQSLQKGSALYTSRVESRDQNSLDPNQLLASPSWFVNLGNLNDDSSQMSPRANLFQQHFFSVLDPWADVYTSSTAAGQLWDRNGFYKRRSYFSQFLILSSGPDRQLGLGSYGITYEGTTQADAVSYRVSRTSVLPRIPADDRDAFTARLTLIENQASRSDPHARVPGAAGSLSIDESGDDTRALYQLMSDGSDPNDATLLMLEQWGLDDITNQTINSPGTGAR